MADENGGKMAVGGKMMVLESADNDFNVRKEVQVKEIECVCVTDKRKWREDVPRRLHAAESRTGTSGVVQLRRRHGSVSAQPHTGCTSDRLVT